jgi:biotin-(acetyl-CoA carboxylase) ligase
MTELRRFTVGISVEQLAVSWARTESAPSGSAVIVDHEIGGRQRLGIPWKVPSSEGFACAVVVRPKIDTGASDVLWLAALVAAARVTGALAGWPDLLFDEHEEQIGSVGLDLQIVHGVIQSAVIALRINLRALSNTQETGAVAESFVSEVLATTNAAYDQREDLLENYTERSALIGKRVRATLIPHGETRGKAIAVDRVGRLVLESPTGMLEYLVPATVLRVSQSN